MKRFLVRAIILGAVVGLGYLGITQFYKGFGPQALPPIESVAPAPEARPIPLAATEDPASAAAADPFSRRQSAPAESPQDVSYMQPPVDNGARGYGNPDMGNADNNAGNGIAENRYVQSGRSAGGAANADPAYESQTPDPRAGQDPNAPPDATPSEPRRPSAPRGASRRKSPFASEPISPDERPLATPADAAPEEFSPADNNAAPPLEEPRNVAPILGADPYARPLAAPDAAQNSANAMNANRAAGDPTNPNLFGPLPGSADGAGPVVASANQSIAALDGIGRPGDQQLEGSQTPSLAIEKQAPSEIQVGKPALFVIKVRNIGSVIAQGVEIRDDVPQGVQFVSATPPAAQPAAGKLVWALGTMKPGDEVTVQMQLTPTAEGEIGSVATVHFQAAASVRTRSTRAALNLQVNTPPSVMIGAPITMKIHLTNPGTGVATGVILTENVPAELKHVAGPELEFEIGALRPGESRDLDLTLTAAQAGHVVNLLSAQGDNNVRADHRAEFDVLAPGLKLGLTGPKRRYLERNATFTLSVSNPGTAPTRDIELAATLPHGMKFVEANNMGHFDAATNTVYWSLEELPPQETGKVTVTAVPQQAGELKLQIRGKAKQDLVDAIEETIAVEGMAAIMFELVDVNDPIEVNGQTTYEIRVLNQGSKAATNVRVVAMLPPEMRPLTADGPVKYGVDGQRVLFEPLGQLAPKADVTYSIKAQALQAGDSRIRVQVMSDEVRNPITKEESTHIYADE